MKKYLKFPLYVALSAMVGMNVTACSDDERQAPSLHRNKH